MNWSNAIKYIEDNKLHKEVNDLANKVGDAYIATIMLYQNVPLTGENIKAFKKISDECKNREKELSDRYISNGHKSAV
jgi:hypothetical protein